MKDRWLTGCLMAAIAAGIWAFELSDSALAQVVPKPARNRLNRGRPANPPR